MIRREVRFWHRPTIFGCLLSRRSWGKAEVGLTIKPIDEYTASSYGENRNSTKVANTTRCTRPLSMLVRPVPKLTMETAKVSSSRI